MACSRYGAKAARRQASGSMRSRAKLLQVRALAAPCLSRSAISSVVAAAAAAAAAGDALRKQTARAAQRDKRRRARARDDDDDDDHQDRVAK